MLDRLRPWSCGSDFTNADWENYVQVARIVQRTDPQVVEEALASFVKAAGREPFTGYDSESKPFLLMRVVFDLPETAPAMARVPYKGWINWPPADTQENVSLAWPISWRSGMPALVAPYEGSEGHPYAAAAEYRHLRATYPFRALGEMQPNKL